MNVHRGSNDDQGFPRWLNVTVVLTLLGLFAYNVLFIGEKAYPTNVIIGGLLGGYIGLDNLKRRKNSPPPEDEPPSPGGGGSSW